MSGFDLAGFPWREPLQEDWGAALAVVTARLADPAGFPDAEAGEIALAARRLASQRLGPLEQIKINRLAQRLWPHRERLPALRPLRVGLLSNRNIDLLAPDLRGAGLARGLLIEVATGPFNAVDSVAFGGARLGPDGPVDATVLMLDIDAFFGGRLPHDCAAEVDAAAAMEQRLQVLAKGLRQTLQAPIILATAPVAADQVVSSADGAIPATRLRLARRLNEAVTAGAEAGHWLLWDLDLLAQQVGADRWFDPARFHQTKAPVAVELNPLVADHLCRVLAVMAGRAGRALVMDLDNTLWGGVIGDDGLEGIRIGQGSPEGEAYLALQRLALALRARGIVLAVCSKNNDDIARRPFADHPDMALRLDHIAVFQANWSDKATNIRAIAATLNLGLGSLVFLDDNPAERARVRQELPDVLVPELGDDPAWYPRLLVASGYLESLVLGEEDLKRADGYQANAQRADLLEQVGNYQDYLRSLRMTMAVEPFDAVGRARIAQLISKSNQFNLTTRRYNEVEVAELENDPDMLTWQVRLADRFSDHGMVGVVIVRKSHPAVWTIDSWLMSCRVLERGLEQALMNRLVALALAEGCERLEGLYRPTGRNSLVETFYDRMGFSPLAVGENGEKRYELTLSGYAPFPVEIALDQDRT